MADMRIIVDGIELEASWTGENPKTWRAVKNALPVEGRANRWGEELYFDIPVSEEEEAAYEEVPRGTVAFWPRGNALCIFWGPTPASDGEEPRAASPVNPFGMVEDHQRLREIEGDARVRVELIE